MTFLDLILGGLLLYAFIKGLWRGLFKELGATVALLAALFIAVKLAKLVSTLTGHGALAAFAITFVAVLVGAYLLSTVFTKLADAAGVGIVNKVLGGVFGCIKMTLLLSVILHFFVKINTTNLFASEETLQKSVFFYPVLKVSDVIFPVLKDWF